MIFLCVQAGLFFYGRSVALSAAREGVSQLRLAQTAPIAARARPGVETGVEGYAVALGRESLVDPVATAVYDDAGGTVTVTVSGTVVTLVPGLHLRATGRASGHVERFGNDTRAVAG